MLKLKEDLLDEYPFVEFYAPNGEYIGATKSEVVFNEFRTQIKKEEAKGYYMIYNGEKIKFDKFGTPEDFPDVFELNVNYLLELL